MDSNGCAQCNITVVGICISLMSNNTENIFISLLVICKFPFMKYKFHQMSLPRLLILLLSCKLLNLYVTLSDIRIVNILPLHFLNNLMNYLMLI